MVPGGPQGLDGHLGGRALRAGVRGACARCLPCLELSNGGGAGEEAPEAREGGWWGVVGT